MAFDSGRSDADFDVDDASVTNLPGQPVGQLHLLRQCIARAAVPGQPSAQHLKIACDIRFHTTNGRLKRSSRRVAGPDPSHRPKALSLPEDHHAGNIRGLQEQAA